MLKEKTDYKRISKYGSSYKNYDELYSDYKNERLYYESSNGRMIILQDMNFKHLQNARDFLEREGSKSVSQVVDSIRILNLELERRGMQDNVVNNYELY